MQRIGRIIRFNHRIRRKFEGGLYLDSRIFLWGDKHFTQTTEKPFFRGRVTTVSRCVMIRCCTRCWVTTESCWAIICSMSLVDTMLSFASLSVRSILIVLVSFSRIKASTLSVHCTSRSSVRIRFSISRCTKNKEKTIPPATKCSLRQSLLWRHCSYYQILSLVCLRNLSHSITPALVSPNGKAIQTPVSPQPKMKPQRYPTGKDITNRI